MSQTNPAVSRNDVLVIAKGTENTIAMAEKYDPDLAAFLKGKAAVASKTIVGPPLIALVTAIVGHYGLGWSAETIAEVVGVLVYLAVAGLRLFAKAVPVTGWFAAAPVTAPNAMGAPTP